VISRSGRHRTTHRVFWLTYRIIPHNQGYHLDLCLPRDRWLRMTANIPTWPECHRSAYAMAKELFRSPRLLAELLVHTAPPQEEPT